MGLYRCPYPPFPFPTYYPDTGTGFGKRNRNSVDPYLQPSFKRGLQCLTLLHTGENVGPVDFTHSDWCAGLLGLPAQ